MVQKIQLKKQVYFVNDSKTIHEREKERREMKTGRKRIAYRFLVHRFTFNVQEKWIKRRERVRCKSQTFTVRKSVFGVTQFRAIPTSEFLLTDIIGCSRCSRQLLQRWLNARKKMQTDARAIRQQKLSRFDILNPRKRRNLKRQKIIYTDWCNAQYTMGREMQLRL